MPGRAAEYMQAILDGEVFEVAQPGIDATQGVVGRDRAANAGFARQSSALRRLDDQAREALAPAPVEPIGLGIFVDQAFELARVAGKPAGNQRRRQVTDRHSRNAPLGLRRLARIADDEGIDDRQRPGDDLRKAFRGERDRLARQPFQRAMGAHMHERVDLRHVLQPKAKGDQRMPRWQKRIVIVGAPLRGAAAIGRQRHPKLAEFLRAETEAAVAHIWIVGRLAPGFVQPRDRCLRHAREQMFVVLDRERRVIGRADSASSKSRGVLGGSPRNSRQL